MKQILQKPFYVYHSLSFLNFSPYILDLLAKRERRQMKQILQKLFFLTSYIIFSEFFPIFYICQQRQKGGRRNRYSRNFFCEHHPSSFLNFFLYSRSASKERKEADETDTLETELNNILRGSNNSNNNNHNQDNQDKQNTTGDLEVFCILSGLIAHASICMYFYVFLNEAN